MIKEEELLRVIRTVLEGDYVSPEEKQEAHQWVRNMMRQGQEHGFTEADVVRAILGLMYNGAA